MMYWNSRSLPELAGLNFRDRMSVLRRAADNLATPKKLLLNILKLIILIPPFLAIARSETMLIAAMWTLGLVVIYPLITRPLTFALVKPLLRQARYQFEQQRQDS